MTWAMAVVLTKLLGQYGSSEFGVPEAACTNVIAGGLNLPNVWGVVWDVWFQFAFH